MNPTQVLHHLFLEHSPGFAQYTIDHAHQLKLLLGRKAHIGNGFASAGNMKGTDLLICQPFQLGVAAGIFEGEMESAFTVHRAAVFQIRLQAVALKIDLNGRFVVETFLVVGEPQEKVNIGRGSINGYGHLYSIGGKGYKSG